MTPAGLVIQKFGGVRKAARATGLSPSTICVWNLPRRKNKRGLGGRIPDDKKWLVVKAAKKHGVNIRFKDLE
jgi:hypothetical protein